MVFETDGQNEALRVASNSARGNCWLFSRPTRHCGHLRNFDALNSTTCRILSVRKTRVPRPRLIMGFPSVGRARLRLSRDGELTCPVALGPTGAATSRVGLSRPQIKRGPGPGLCLETPRNRPSPAILLSERAEDIS